MERNTASRHDGGMEYMLKLYGPPRDGTTIREGIGTFNFIAEGHEVAIAFAEAEYAERLAESDYAYLENAGGRPIRQWGIGYA